MPFRGLVYTIATLIAALLGSVATAAAFDISNYPNLSGIWLPVTLRGGDNQGAFDPTKPWGRGQQAPLTPEYQVVLEASLETRQTAVKATGIPARAACRPVCRHR
jgi:ABC-type transport system substrate-binding protein